MRKQTTYRLESTFTGYEGKSETTVNEQPVYDAVYTALTSEDGTYFDKINGMYCDDDGQWHDTEENKEEIAEMMRKEIERGNAIVI